MWDIDDNHKILFRGTLQKIRLISNNVVFGPIPEPNDLIEQRLTINRLGHVWLSYYAFGNGFGEHKCAKTERLFLDKDAVQRIFDAFTYSFTDYQELLMTTDVGDWEMTLTNTDKVQFKLLGCLVRYDSQNTAMLSDMLRKELNHHDLYAFDGGEYEEDEEDKNWDD